MTTILAALEVLRTFSAAIMCLYFIGAQFKRVKSRKRNATLFMWPLVFMLLVSVGNTAVAIIRAGEVPNIQALTATLLYIFGLLLQIDHLWPSTAENKQPAWHAHLGTWTIMAVFDMLAILELAIMPRSSTIDLVCSAVTISLRCCLGLALFVMFAWPDQGGHIQLGDSIMEDTAAAQSNFGNDGGGLGPKPLALRQSIRDTIREAGGSWQWAKKFRIFLPWIWPSVLPWMKLRVFASLLILLAQMLLKLYTPYVEGLFVEGLSQAFKNGVSSPDWKPLWKPLTLLTAMRLAMYTGLDSLETLLWRSFSSSRQQLANTRIYTHLMRHEAAFHDMVSPTDVTLAIDLGMNVCNALDSLVLRTVPEIATFIGAVITIFSLYGPHVALVQGCVVALNTLLILRSNQTMRSLYDAEKKARQNMVQQRQGGLRGWHTVSLYGQNEREIETYTTSLSIHTGTTWKRILVNLGFGLASDMIANLGFLAAIALVILHGFRTGRTIRLVVAFRGYWSLLQGPLSFFTRIPSDILSDLYNADQLRRILEIEPTMTYGTENLRLTRGCIEFQDVTASYAYSGDKVFSGLNLVIPPGKTTALVGPSGVGKSTLLALIIRLYDPKKGLVMIDGQDISTLKRSELPKYISVMAQSPHLFYGTIMDNIRYGRPDAADSEVQDAAKSAGIHAHIMRLPEQYNTVVREGGGTFSGGEMQRLALARALIKKAKILICDEATSAQDADTEAHIRKGIEAFYKGHTKIIIAHRLSSVKHADNIVVLGKGTDGFGEVIEQGKHDELVERDGDYAQLWKKHLGEDKDD
ncbi:P-loop containing nucleoside triphosphate hydrolase protein [Aspergillus filifer]